MQETVGVAGFDALPPERVTSALAPCCASRRWQAAMLAGRPYGTRAVLLSASDAALAALDWSDVLEALDAHPRIGQRVAGADTESAWSRQEQAGAAAGPATVAEELREANAAYEQRFGHVFLICATGRSAAEMLAAARERLQNDRATEQAVVREELRQIVRLRLAKASGPAQIGAAAH